MKGFKELSDIREAISVIEYRIEELEATIRNSNNAGVKIFTRDTLENNKQLLESYKVLLKKEEKLIL